jgi:hypothetical protein
MFHKRNATCGMWDEEMIIGFMDESSPQTTGNTRRLWSFGKPTIYKNTDKIKANAFGCYMLNRISVIDFKEHSEWKAILMQQARLKRTREVYKCQALGLYTIASTPKCLYRID